MTDAELTHIYNTANKLDPARHNPITTQRIFTAMRAMVKNTNDITGDKLITKPTTNEYAEGWDRVFGKTQYKRMKEVENKLLQEQQQLFAQLDELNNKLQK